MKKLIIILIILIASFINANSQWVKVCDTYSGGVDAFTDNGSIIYAAVTGDGIYKSTNNGNNWVFSNPIPNHILQFAITAIDSFVFVGTDTGTFKSTNYGYNWTFVNRWSYSLTIINSNNDNYLFAGSLNMYRTSNWGLNWIIYKNGLPRYPVVFTLSNSNNSVFAGVTTSISDSMGIYKTIDYGDNWTFISANYNIYSQSLYSVGNFIISGGDKVFLSTNSGSNWRHIPGIQNSSYLFGFASNGTKDIFISSWSDGFYVSNDTGQTWNLRNEGLGNLYPTALHRFGNYLYISLNPLYGNGGIFRRPVSEVIGIKNISTEIPTSSHLYQNYPNPFNPASIIKYQIKKNNFVSLKIYDLLGKEIETLVNEKQSAGIYEVNFDGSNLSSGMYLYSLSVDGNIVDTKKLILLK